LGGANAKAYPSSPLLYHSPWYNLQVAIMWEIAAIEPDHPIQF